MILPALFYCIRERNKPPHSQHGGIAKAHPSAYYSAIFDNGMSTFLWFLFPFRNPLFDISFVCLHLLPIMSIAEPPCAGFFPANFAFLGGAPFLIMFQTNGASKNCIVATVYFAFSFMQMRPTEAVCVHFILATLDIAFRFIRAPVLIIMRGAQFAGLCFFAANETFLSRARLYFSNAFAIPSFIMLFTHFPG